MKILDSKGRLFGKVSILDLGAACVIFLVIFGIFFYPGTTGSIAQINNQTKIIEVDILVRWLGLSDPQAIEREFGQQTKANIIIRNQPAGEVELRAAKLLPITVSVPQPDGSVKALPDPRPELQYIKDVIITVTGKGQITSNGAVLGNQKVKIGSLIELDSLNYNFKGNVMGVRQEGEG